nr:tyrosine-type recombinase/integrase [Streptomyces sp. CJ_13]
MRRRPSRSRLEDVDERPVATVDQVFALAEAIGIRWRLVILLGAFASMRPEDLAELRRADIDHDTGSLRVRRAAPELNTGPRVIGDPKSRAGKREIMLPGFVLLDVRRHLEWFAQDGPDGLVFVGERGAALRGTAFGRKWRKARDAVGMSKEFRVYDLRHTGNTPPPSAASSRRRIVGRAPARPPPCTGSFPRSRLLPERHGGGDPQGCGPGRQPGPYPCDAWRRSPEMPLGHSGPFGAWWPRVTVRGPI